MADQAWEAKLKDFLKKAGDDFKKAGTEVKAEARRLVAEVNDEESRARVRARLREVGDWARKTGDELSTLVDKGLTKAETVLEKASGKVKDFAVSPNRPSPWVAPSDAPAPAPPPPPTAEAAAPAPAPAARKTVGRARAPRAASPKAPRATRKTVGKARKAPPKP